MEDELNAIEFSPYAQDFINYTGSYLDVLEGTTGGGKTVAANFKFILNVYDSPSRNHIIAGQDSMKIEQNIITDEKCGIVAMFKYIDENGKIKKLVEYCPNGKGDVKSPHVRVHHPKGDKIIYLISYNDSVKWKNIRGGRYGCSFVDECNLVVDKTVNSDTVPQFLTEIFSRTDDHVILTLNPDNPELPLYKEYINRARPISKYKNKGPKEIRNMLNSPEDPDYKWWFFDFYDNPIMTEKKIERIKNGCRGNRKDWLSRIEGIRAKTEGLAFQNFDDEKCVLSTNQILNLRNNPELKLKNENIIFRHFYCGIDTSFSHKTDDLIAIMFVGITTKGDVYILNEFTFNNRDAKSIEDRMDGTDVSKKLDEFLTENSKFWGYPEYSFLDEADSNTATTLAKDFKNSPFNIKLSAKHSFPIPARLAKINELINKNKYFVCDVCTTHIYEMNVITLDPKDNKRIEDKNNHTYDAVCYAIEPSFLRGEI